MNYCTEASNVLTKDNLSFSEKWSIFQLISNILRFAVKKRHFTSEEHLNSQVLSFEIISKNLSVLMDATEEPGRKFVISKYISNIELAISQLKKNGNSMASFEKNTKKTHRKYKRSSKNFHDRNSEKEEENKKEETKEQA